MRRTRKVMATLVSAAVVSAGGMLVAVPAAAAAWQCPDVYSGGTWWGAICLYKDKEWRTNSSIYGYSETAAGKPIFKYEGRTSRLKYNGFSTTAHDNATSLANGSTGATAYFYEHALCGGAMVSLGPTHGDRDLNDGTGAKFDDRISAMHRSGYLTECRND